VNNSVIKTASSTPTPPSLSKAIDVDQALVAKDLQYLASDELGGRGTGSEGIEKAAVYIAEVFAEAQISTIPGLQQYAQQVPLVEQNAPISASLKVADKNYVLGEDLLVLDQSAIDQSGALRFIGHATVAEITTMDLQDAIVVTMAGSKSDSLVVME